MTAKPRLAIVVSHPIQHFTHFYRALAREPWLEVKVLFCSRIGLERYFDREMQTEIAWAGDLMTGYDHEFLPEAGGIKRTGIFALDNPSLGRHLAAFAPDAVLGYGYATITALRTIAWCRLNGVPLLMTGDGEAVRRRSSVRAALRSAAVRAIFSQVSAFLTVGDQNETMLAAAGVSRERMFRTPFTIDETAYRAARDHRARLRHEVRSRHAIPDTAFLGLFVGKLSGRKRPRDLLAAWTARAAEARAAGLHLLYCGNGEERADLEQYAASAGIPATFAGFINVDALPGYYAAADCLVHPAEQDPHPLICSEAACIGLPMILSDRVGAVGPTDVARAGENVVVTPCGDVGALADALLALASDPVRRERMSAASLAAFEDNRLSVSVAGVEAALRHLTATPRHLPARAQQQRRA